MHFTHLGQVIDYPDNYNPKLLQAVNRQRPDNMPKNYYGFDLWWAYEISWLDPNNKPSVAIAEITFPADSKYLIESKSLKLYLNSLNMHVFGSHLEVERTIIDDLSRSFNGAVQVKVLLPENWQSAKEKNYKCIDHLPAVCRFERIIPEYLTKSSEIVEEKLMSNLLKSNCLITKQPDWGSIFINYRGPQIDPTGLLQYIVSYRNHNGFHENCIDRIFADIMQYCQPEMLILHAQYTRRGGLDINPVRSNKPMVDFRLSREIRQ